MEFTAPITGFRDTELVWWLQGPFSAWKQVFAISYLGFSMMRLPLCSEGLGEAVKRIWYCCSFHSCPHHLNRLLTGCVKLNLTASMLCLLSCVRLLYACEQILLLQIFYILLFYYCCCCDQNNLREGNLSNLISSVQSIFCLRAPQACGSHVTQTALYQISNFFLHSFISLKTVQRSSVSAEMQESLNCEHLWNQKVTFTFQTYTGRKACIPQRRARRYHKGKSDQRKTQLG